MSPVLEIPRILSRRASGGRPGSAWRISLLFASSLLLTRAHAGHELPIYPSYYPQEIRIETVDPEAAASRLRDAGIHAYVGADLAFDGKTPANMSSVESLGSYLVITFNPASQSVREREGRCSARDAMLSALAGPTGAFVLHPYPVTPYDMDYLQHLDLAEAAKRPYLNGSARGRGGNVARLRVRTRGPVAEKLARPRWPSAETRWDAALEEIPAAALVESHSLALNGWMGPPWVKEGWYHAYLLLADALGDPAAKQSVDSIVRRLERGDYEGLEERLNLERTLVGLLTTGCERVVAGYTVKPEYFNSEFTAGVENIAYDSHTGLNSPLFLRTVKLKDFPWNGWLRLGINAKPTAAWNPVGGFTDPAGRLIWFAVGDPALMPAPYSASWVINRVADARWTLEDDWRRREGAR